MVYWSMLKATKDNKLSVTLVVKNDAYSVYPRDRIFVKGYGFLSFAKNVAKNIRKIESKNLSSKCSQNFLDHVKQSTADAFKTASKRTIKKQPKQMMIYLAKNCW